MSSFHTTSRFLKIVFQNNKSKAFVAFFIMMSISILNLCTPQVIRVILDDAITNSKIDLLLKLVFLYIVISTSSALFSILLSYIYSKMNKSMSSKLKIKLLRHLSKLSGNYYTNIKTGNILSIMENDMFIVESFGAETVFSLIVDVISAFIALFFLIKMDFDLLLIVVALQLLLALCQTKFTKAMSSKTNEIRQDSGDISNIVQEYISNILNVVISKSSLNFFRKYIKKEKSLIKKYIDLNLITSSSMSVATILSNLINIGIYGYGGFKIIKGTMSIGELIAFQQYATMLMGPCIRIIRSNTRLQQSLVSINRIFSVLDEPITIKQYNNKNKIKDNFNGDIVFDEVSFSYDEDKTLDNISIKFEKGKISALVGSSGCGKSTIVNLLFRLWDINEGNIFIDNINIKDYSLKSLRKNIAIVTQDLLLFDDSILNNLILGNKDINKEFIENVCHRVDIYNFINELPKGFNTIIGEKV